jgi:hypothetical protein
MWRRKFEKFVDGNTFFWYTFQNILANMIQIRLAMFSATLIFSDILFWYEAEILLKQPSIRRKYSGWRKELRIQGWRRRFNRKLTGPPLITWERDGSAQPVPPLDPHQSGFNSDILPY